MKFSFQGAYLQLILSNRVGEKTRDALLKRAKPALPDYQPATLTIAHLETLQAVIDCVLPQKNAPFIDLAVRIDQQLSAGAGDGWRRAELPCDAQAYKNGLHTLNGIADVCYSRRFSELDTSQQDEILTCVVEGNLPCADTIAQLPPFSAKQLQLWFEDLRADAVRLYVSHPATLERMGYSGIANGGDGQPKSGFVKIGLNQGETWEPMRTP